jgi:deoxyadenosine kinase
MLIAIAGLIGSGKSTLVEHLDGIKFYEPVESNPYLSLYYKEPEKYCFPMQMHLLHERYRMIRNAYYQSLNGQDCIMDRSIYEDFCFASLGAKAHYMSELEFQTYCKAHEDYCSDLIPFPDLIIYLKAEIPTLLEHIKKRDRNCEAGIMAPYLENLQSEYDLIIPRLEQKTKVVTIEVDNLEAIQVLSKAQGIIKQRKEEINSCYPRYRGGW